MKIRLTVCLSAIALLMTGPVLAKGSFVNQAGISQIGKIEASFDGSNHNWYTVQGSIGGEEGASANWMKADTLGSADLSEMADQMKEMMQDQLSPEQLKQIEQLGDKDNPMAQLLEQMQAAQPDKNSDEIELSITGFDPNSDMDSFMNQAIGINLSFDSKEQAIEKIGRTIPADISFIVESNGYMPKVLYSSDDDDQPSSVVFEKLEFDGNNGSAKGSFKGQLCRIDMSNLMAGMSKDDCKEIKGKFDTKLIFEQG